MPPRRRRQPDGVAVLVTGSRGSGKSTWTMQQTASASRLLVWDSLGQWSRERRVTRVDRLNELHRLIVTDLQAPGAFRYGYVPINLEAFDTFCRLAYVWLKAAAGGVLVAEELADVTSPGKAPQAWGAIVRKSRHESSSVIYGLTQRPAESDKTLPGNADIIHAGRQSFPRDRKTMAEYLDVPLEDVTALEGVEWIERDMRDRALRRGVLKFKK